MAKKYVEMYSSSNAAAQDPTERVQLTNMQITGTEEKQNWANKTTDRPRMT